MKQQTRGHGPTTTTVAAMLVAFALAVAATLAAAPVAADESGTAVGVACVSYLATAPYWVDGYNHVLTITNGCTRPVTCTVRTDVNPQPIETLVAAGSTSVVTTFRGSPASVFVPTVECRYA